MKKILLSILATILIFGSIGFLLAEDEIQPLINTQIIASTLSGSTPLIVEFNTDADNIENYIWSFSNTTDVYSNKATQIFSLPGEYLVSLKTTSSNGEITTSQIQITANDTANCEPDYDNDGFNNCVDLCPLIAGDAENTGCPLLAERCDSKCGCSDGYVCNYRGDQKLCAIEGICIPKKVEESCLYQAENNYIFGNVICNSCPCKHSLEYNATIRDCDILFPAITSANKRNIYEKGEFFEVR